MIEFHELLQGVWLFPDSQDGHNCVAVVGERAVLLVDPGEGDIDRRAVSKFIEENAPGREVRVAVRTVGVAVQGDTPGAHILGHGEKQNGVSLPDLIPGWEVITLGEAGSGRAGVYNASLRVLFCGEMLADPQVGIPRLTADSQGYLDALAQIEELELKLAVPRRGSPASGKRAIRARIEGDRNYIYSLLRHVYTTQAANLPLERAIQVASQIYDTFPHLQDHLANMRAVWGELA